MSSTNGITPQWYREIVGLLTIQQSEVFLLHGDVQGYPVYPGELLSDFLARMTLGPVRRRLKGDGADEASEEAVARDHLFAVLTISGGLRFSSPEGQAAFERVVPSQDANPFAGQQVDVAAEFAKLAAYYRDPSAVPLGLVVLDSDILFDADAPMVEPERTLISHLRSWASRPLVAADGRAHRVFLVANSRVGVRNSLVQGRVSTVRIPLPSREERAHFIEGILSEPGGPEVQLEEGLDVAGVARITGALNLQQIEDVIYQAQVSGGVLTRKQVQERKDSLVRDVYGSVIEIQYPESGFEALAGYDGLKSYFTDYVEPLLRAGDPLCPKGACLSGPPGCLDGGTPIYDPVDGSIQSVAERHRIGQPFHVYALDEGTGDMVVADADAPYKYAPAELFEVVTELGHTFTATGGHRIWTGEGYVSISSLSGSSSSPLPTIGGIDHAGFPGGAFRWTRRPAGSQGDRPTHRRSDGGRPLPCGGSGQGHAPSPVDSGRRSHSFEPWDGRGAGVECGPPRASRPRPKTGSARHPGLPTAIEWVRPPVEERPGRCAYSSPESAPSPGRFGGADRPPRVDAALRQSISCGGSAGSRERDPRGIAGVSSPRKHTTCRIAPQSAAASVQRGRGGAPLHPVAAFDSTPSRATCSVRSLASQSPFGQWQVDRIVSIHSVGVNHYFDFHVPVHENYWACGAIHHNTGKSEFAKALAGAVHLPLVVVRTDRIKDKFVGESNKKMARLTEGIVALAPAVILIDEIDKALPTGDDNTGVSQEILGQLQTFLSEIPRGTAFFIATTNFPSRIPRALLRPGRFEEGIPLLPAHMDGVRGDLFALLAERMGLPCGEVDWARHGEAAKDTTGADVERVLIKANRIRVAGGAELIVDAHVEKALESLVPTVATCQEMVIEALAFCADKSYIPEGMLAQAKGAVEEVAKRRRTIQTQVV